MWKAWFSALLVLSSIGTEGSEFATWSYDSKGTVDNVDLPDTFVLSTSKESMVTQCAAACLTKSTCRMFVFNEVSKTCKLSSKTITEIPKASRIPKTNSTFYPNKAFSIEQAFLGPCTAAKCKNGGTCLIKERESSKFACICRPGYTGTLCESKSEAPKWSAWKGSSPCSVTCGTGYKTSSRQCVLASTDSKVDNEHCAGSARKIESCTGPECPRWGKWGTWSSCSTVSSCGRGQSVRTRECPGGKPNVDGGCVGIAREQRPCAAIACDANAAPLRLSGGSVIGEGAVEIYNNLTKTWGRVCAANFDATAGKIVCNTFNFAGLHEVKTSESFTAPTTPFSLKLKKCRTGDSVIQACPHEPMDDVPKCSRTAEVVCKVNGNWSPWSVWSACDVTCGEGKQTRERTCSQPEPARGLACPGDKAESKPCKLSPCAVDGKWKTWSSWSSCNVSCGGGLVMRQRECTTPQHGGKGCAGDATEVKACNEQKCPVDGKWEDWSKWTKCNVTCGGGIQMRTRTCKGPFYGGKNCDGETKETKACNTHNCPEHGTWDPWLPWSACNASCGGGYRFRTRKCNEPKYGGNPCKGPNRELEICNVHNCPVDGKWNSWSDWKNCSKQCGNGTTSRTRECIGPFYGGKLCEGPAHENKSCNVFPCPVPGYWEEWSSWTTCTKTCENGTTTRSRKCVGPFYGGKPCDGQPKETKLCNKFYCPVDGKWTNWTPWSACSKTCSEGTESRQRTCNPPQYGGKDCPGDAKEVQPCNLGPCPHPGMWGDWGPWSACTVTCQQGSRMRWRTCNKVIPNAPLKGCNGTDRNEEICNDFSCLPYLQSCSAWKKAGLREDGISEIDPDGSGSKIQVYCNLTGSEEGETVVHHDMEKSVTVNNFENPGMKELYPKYDGITKTTFQKLSSLVDNSKSCRQYLKIKCRGSTIHQPTNPDLMMTWWENRNAGQMKYWGGSNPANGNCACSLTNSCAWKNVTCNCDANDFVWRTDEGFLTHRPHLPVKAVRVGDTGDPDEKALITLGPLICRG